MRWNTLEEFAQWYKDNKYPVRIPADAKVYVTDQTYSIAWFREKNYQVELYLVKPNTSSPKHSHTTDQIPIFLGGEMLAGHGSPNSTQEISGHSGKIEDRYPNLDWPHPDAYGISEVLPAGHWHRLTALNNGSCFFVIQKWDEDQSVTSAVMDWEGESIGPIHEEIIKKNI